MSEVISPLHYQVSIASISQHLLNVSLTIKASHLTSLHLALPAWIPGSYMIRDFAKNIIHFNPATPTGSPLAWQKLDKQQWIIDNHGQDVVLNYQVYAFDLSVRSAYLDDEYGFFNGTSVFLAVEEFSQQPCELSIVLPEDCAHWQLETSMPKHPASNRYICENYDELIDHPVFLGSLTRVAFHVNKVEFVLMFSGNHAIDFPRLVKDLTPICQHHLDLFTGPAPIDRYVFMTLVADQGYGGLEHRSSTALLYPRFELPFVGDNDTATEGYVNFLSLCSHELFHTWHVKRIKPEVMIQPNLQGEVYTNQLWIYEGFTSYYDDLAVARAGVISAQDYIEIVGKNLTRLQQNKGRFKQSIAESSFDAWTKFYQQDASAINNIVSYYNKGGIVALGLDLFIRRESQQAYNLDDLMRLLWQEYGCKQVGTPDNVIATLCQQHFAIDVSDYLDRVVYGTEDVALEQELKAIGVSLHYRPKQGLTDKGGTPPDLNSQNKRHLGAHLKSTDFGVTVMQVRESLAACQAGVQVNDRIIAINDYIATESVIQRVLDTHEGDHVSVTVARKGRLLTLDLPLLAPPLDTCYLTIDDEAKFSRWLKG
jgi:predicted metalloprotease with PDZ domain